MSVKAGQAQLFGGLGGHSTPYTCTGQVSASPVPVHLGPPEPCVAPDAQEAAHALAAAPGLFTGLHRAAVVIVIDADALAVLEAVPAYAAGVALVGQELVEPLLG